MYYILHAAKTESFEAAGSCDMIPTMDGAGAGEGSFIVDEERASHS